MSDTPKDDPSKNEAAAEDAVIDVEAKEVSDASPDGDKLKTEAPSAARTSGGSRLLVGASLGVAVAAVAVLGLASQGILNIGAGGDADVGALEDRIKALESSTENADAAQVQAINELRTRLASLDARVQSAALDGDGMASADVTALSEEIAALKTQMAQLETPVGETSEVSSTDLQTAQHEIENLQRALQGVSSHVETVDQGLAKADVRLGTLEKNAPPEDLDQILNSLSSKSDVAALQSRLAGLEKFNTIDATQQATLALAAADLAEASKSSAPFVTELDAFNMLSPGNNTARELRAYAVSGVPTDNVLAKQFGSLMNKAIREEKLAKADAWYKRSWAAFTTTFDMRRVGEVEGTTTKAILSRAEVRVNAGDLDAAAAELEGLQGAAKETMANWLHDVKARARVNGLVAKLNASVQSDLNDTLNAAGER